MAGTFKIIISPDGSAISVDIGDVIGASCTKLTDVFASIGKDIDVEKKTEYYMEVEEPIQVSG